MVSARLPLPPPPPPLAWTFILRCSGPAAIAADPASTEAASEVGRGLGGRKAGAWVELSCRCTPRCSAQTTGRTAGTGPWSGQEGEGGCGGVGGLELLQTPNTHPKCAKLMSPLYRSKRPSPLNSLTVPKSSTPKLLNSPNSPNTRLLNSQLPKPQNFLCSQIPQHSHPLKPPQNCPKSLNPQPPPNSSASLNSQASGASSISQTPKFLQFPKLQIPHPQLLHFRISLTPKSSNSTTTIP